MEAYNRQTEDKQNEYPFNEGGRELKTFTSNKTIFNDGPIATSFQFSLP
jgi:hypothetical protein